VGSPRIDLLGQTGDGTFVHVELQSANDACMALRMSMTGFACTNGMENQKRSPGSTFEPHPLEGSRSVQISIPAAGQN